MISIIAARSRSNPSVANRRPFGVPFAQWRAPHEDESERLAASAAFIKSHILLNGISSMTLKIGWIGLRRHATQMLLPHSFRHDVQIGALCDITAIV